jgi:hypothetical protein
MGKNVDASSGGYLKTTIAQGLTGGQKNMRMGDGCPTETAIYVDRKPSEMTWSKSLSNGNSEQHTKQ